MSLRLIISLALLIYACFGFTDNLLLPNTVDDQKTPAQDKYLREAKAIIGEQGDLFVAKNCLLKSFSLFQSGEAAFILGKMYLFGFAGSNSERNSNMSNICMNTTDIAKHKNSKYFFGNLTEEQSISSTSPNLTRAAVFFNYSHKLGDQDAGVFLYYIYKQSQILQPNKTLIPELNSKQVLDAFAKSQLRGSLFANLVKANAIYTCNKLSRKKYKPILELKSRYKAPILHKDDVFADDFRTYGDFAQGLDVAEVPCRECADALLELVPVLSDVVSYLQKRGGAELPPPRLDTFHQDVVKDEEDVDFDMSANIEILKQQAERGDMNSQVSLGDAFFFGNPEAGIERDLEEAQRYYAMAANQNNNPHAQNALGIMKMQAIGTERNETEAVDLFFKSAEQGEVSSMNALGYAYLYGAGVEQNSTLAIEWLEKAAMKNHTESEGNLGTLLRYGSNGVKKNETKAVFYMTRAAKKGQPLSLLNLALLYIEKQYSPSFVMNISCWEIFSMARKAVLQGSYNNFQLLAFRSYREKEFDKAYVHYSFGAMLGFEDSVYASAFLWEKERPGNFKCRHNQSALCALAYYYQLYLLGNEEYLTKMADLIYDQAELENSTQDLNRSFKLYNYSVIANNDPRALHSFAWMLEQGIGTERNTSLAMKYYQDLTNGYLRHDFEISAFIVGLVQQIRLKIVHFLDYLFK